MSAATTSDQTDVTALEDMGKCPQQERIAPMSNDRRLTREEQRTVEAALEIIDGWIRAHVNDQQRPYGFTDVAAAHRDLCDSMWTMTEEVQA